MEVTSFRYENCLCCCFEFPVAVVAGESLLGLVVVGPAHEWQPEKITAAPVHYFVLDRTPTAGTAIKKWTPSGFVPVGPGPKSGSPTFDFTDMVLEALFGKRRPTAQDAARRLLILKSIVTYARATQFGQALHSHPDVPAAAKADLHTIMGGMFSETLHRDNLWDHVTPREREFFETPVQSLSKQQVIDASWRSEAIQTLMWALGMSPKMPAYDCSIPGEVAPKVPVDNTAEFVRSAKLRDDKELDHARNVAELWHWRSRTRQLEEEGKPFTPSESLKKIGILTYADVIRMSAIEAAKAGDIPACIGDDFPVAGKSYRDLTAEEWSRVRSLSFERHFTLNWLCGYALANNWERTPTDT